MHDATALVDRVELKHPEWKEPVVAGFRRDGQISLYFGAEPVYQFNDHGEFRRGFWRGCLLKADDRRLVRLRRSEHAELLRSELNREDYLAWLKEMLARLNSLRNGLLSREAIQTNEVSVSGQTRERVQEWLDDWIDSYPSRQHTIAVRPNVTAIDS